MGDLKSDHIGDLGEDEVRIFFRRWAWHPRKDEKDQGIDFSVEIPGDGSGVRRRFLVQVKTCNPVTELKSGDWSISIDKGALRKYAATREPVLVIACDLPTKRLRAIHIQNYLQRRAVDLAEDGDVSVRFPTSRDVDAEDRDSFRHFVDAAWDYQDSVHFPATKSIAQVEAELSQLDPRLKLDVTATRDGYQLNISAIEAVEFNFAVKPSTKDDAISLERTFKYGSPSSVRYDELELSNPLLRGAMSSASGVLDIGPSDPTRVMLRMGRIREKKKRNTLHALIQMRGHINQGSHGYTVRSVDDEVPFGIEARIDHVNRTAEVDFNVLDKPLVGLPVATLPYVKKLHEMFDVGAQGELGMQVLRGDQPAAPPMRLVLSDPETGRTLMQAMGHYVAQIVALSEVARRRKVDIYWESIKDSTDSERGSWLTGLRLIERQDVLMQAPEEFLVTAGSDISLNDPPDNTSGRFFFIKGGSYTITGWGRTLCTLPIDVFLHAYDMVPTGADPKQMVVRPGTNSSASMRLAASNARILATYRGTNR